jgi:hypothetical protein
MAALFGLRGIFGVILLVPWALFVYGPIGTEMFGKKLE